MTERARLTHQLDGRARLAIPARRGDAAYFSMLSAQLAGTDAVRSVRVNPLTGSVLVEFSGSLDQLVDGLDGGAALEVERPASAVAPAASHAAVANTASAAGHADGANPGPGAGPPAAAGAAPAIPVAPAPPWRVVSGRELSPMHMAGALFSVVGVIQTVRGRVMMPALTAFWYAVHAFREADRTANGRSVDGAPSTNGGSDVRSQAE